MKKLGAALALLFLAAIVFGFRHFQGGEPKRWFRPITGEPLPQVAFEEWITPRPDTRGKFVLLDFWATWCRPCLKAIPELNRIQKKYAGRLVVIGLAENSAAEVRALASPKIEYAVAVDSTARLKNQLEIRGIPHALLIDPKGIVRYEGSPAIPGEELTDAKIDRILRDYGNP